MSEPLSLTTADPGFSPDKPIRVNGHLFLPAKRVLANKPRKPVLVESKRKRMIEA